MNENKKPRKQKTRARAEEIDASLVDLGNAQILTSLCQGRSMWVVDHRKWLEWDGTRWERDLENLSILQRAKAIRLVIDDLIKVEPVLAKRQQLRSQQERASTISGIRAAIELARPNLRVREQDLDNDPDVIAGIGQYISLRSGIITDPCPSMKITKMAGSHIEQPPAPCPRWEAFLAETFNNEEMISFVQRAVGYTLTGLVGERCIFVCHGPGANGKSTFVRVLLAMMGDYGMSASSDLLVGRGGNKIPNDVARLRGARCVVLSEPGEGEELAEGLVKELTGGDVISARFLYGEFFDFIPEAKFWMTTNHRPVIKGSDDAVWDRVRLLPFDNVVPKEKRNSRLLSDLLGELPGIFSWAVQGAKEWYAKGLGSSAAVSDATSGYRSEMDQVATFLEDQVVQSQWGKIGATLLYTHYRDWCKRMGEDSMLQGDFGRRLTMKGIKKKRGTSGRWVYLGLVLKHAVEED